MNFIKEWAGTVALIAIVLTWLFPSPAAMFGSVNGGNVTNFDAVDVTDGYYINGLGVITTTISKLTGLFTVLPTAVATTTSGTGSTVSQADLLAAQYTTVNLGAANDYTLTLPATSTMTTLLPNTGNYAQWCYTNATTTAGVDLIFAAGTGIDLQMATSSSLIESLGATDSACITLQRKSNTDILARLLIYTASD